MALGYADRSTPAAFIRRVRAEAEFINGRPINRSEQVMRISVRRAVLTLVATGSAAAAAACGGGSAAEYTLLVDRLFDGMRQLYGGMMAPVFADDARLSGLDSHGGMDVSPAAEFVASLTGRHGKRPIAKLEIRSMTPV